MSEPFIGEIRMAGFNFAPRDWLLCNGQLLAISQNTALFSLLGVQYGGNGTTNFAIPDLRGRVPVNWGNGPGLSPSVIGQRTGVESVTLLTTQMPAHSHAASGTSSANARDPRGNLPAASFQNRYDGSPNTTMHPSAVAIAGGGLPHDNMGPFLAVTYIICAAGIFPSRN